MKKSLVSNICRIGLVAAVFCFGIEANAAAALAFCKDTRAAYLDDRVSGKGKDVCCLDKKADGSCTDAYVSPVCKPPALVQPVLGAHDPCK